jgi:hypothetical protein
MVGSEGLVEAEHNRCVRVAAFPSSELDQIDARRIVVEAMAVRATVRRFDDLDLARLRGLQDAMESFMADPRKHLAKWEEFHGALNCLPISRAGGRILDDARTRPGDPQPEHDRATEPRACSTPPRSNTPRSSSPPNNARSRAWASSPRCAAGSGLALAGREITT